MTCGVFRTPAVILSTLVYVYELTQTFNNNLLHYCSKNIHGFLLKLNIVKLKMNCCWFSFLAYVIFTILDFFYFRIFICFA